MRWVLESLAAFWIIAAIFALLIWAGVMRIDYRWGDTHIVLPPESAR